MLDLGDIDQVHRRVQRCSYTLQQAEKCQAAQAAVHHKVYITAGSCSPLGIGTKQYGPFDPMLRKDRRQDCFQFWDGIHLIHIGASLLMILITVYPISVTFSTAFRR